MPTLSVTHIVHKIAFNRSGECKPTEACREGCWRECIDECPHGMLVDGLPVCTIHEQLGQLCDECSKARGDIVTHQVCADFPDHPWLKVIQDGTCGYSFTRLDESGNVSDEPLPFTRVEE